MAAADGATAFENGSSYRDEPHRRPRRLGVVAARHRAQRLINGQGDLPPHKAALLASTGRLLTHFENISNGLFYRTEFTRDDQLREAVSTLMQLDRQIAENLRRLFPEGDETFHEGDPLAALLQRNDSAKR